MAIGIYLPVKIRKRYIVNVFMSNTEFLSQSEFMKMA